MLLLLNRLKIRHAHRLLYNNQLLKTFTKPVDFFHSLLGCAQRLNTSNAVAIPGG